MRERRSIARSRAQSLIAAWTAIATWSVIATPRATAAEIAASGAKAEAGTSTPAHENGSAQLEVFLHFVGLEHPQELDAKIAGWFLSQTGKYTSTQQEHVRSDELFGDRTPGLHVFVTRVEPGRLRIFFVCKDGGVQRYLVRDVQLPSGLDEVALENTAQVVFAASIALWEGREEMARERVSAELSAAPTWRSTRRARRSAMLGERQSEASAMGEDPALVARDAAPPRRTTSPAPYLVASAGYTLRHRGPGGVAHGPLLGLGIARRARAEFGVRATGALLLPVALDRADVELALRGYSLALEPWLEIEHARAVRLVGSLALGADVVRVSASTSARPDLAPAAPAREIDPFAAPRFGAYFDLAPFRVGIAAELAFQLVQRHYDVAEAGEQRALITAWRVQPGLLAQILFAAP